MTTHLIPSMPVPHPAATPESVHRETFAHYSVVGLADPASWEKSVASVSAKISYFFLLGVEIRIVLFAMVNRRNYHLRWYGYVEQHVLAIALYSRGRSFHLRPDCPDGQ
jgi:hypothetical protein